MKNPIADPVRQEASRHKCRLGTLAALVAVASLAGAVTGQCRVTPLIPSTLTNGFGTSVAMSGDILVVGGPVLIGNAGYAFVFARDAAGAWTEQASFSESGGPGSADFGSAVDASGDTVVVGFPSRFRGFGPSGGAFVYQRDAGGSWTEQAELVPLFPIDDDNFGRELTLSGDTALVAGDTAVHAFTRDGGGIWTYGMMLTGNDAVAGDGYGDSLSLDGDTVMIGAPTDDDDGTDSGSVYVFTRDGSGVWTQQVKLTASDAAAGDGFGTSVSLLGDLAFVGATGDDDDGSDSGSVYVFARDGGGTWSQQGKLVAEDADANDHFGSSVALNSDMALIGSIDDEGAGLARGSAYVFMRNSSGDWTQHLKLPTPAGRAFTFRFAESLALYDGTAVVGAASFGFGAGDAFVYHVGVAKLTADDAASFDDFGDAISLSGTTAVLGAHSDDSSQGSAYVFDQDASGSWTQQAKLTAADPGLDDFFGLSVDLSGDTALVGSPQDDDTGADSGSAYVFVRDAGGNWAQQAKLTASDAAAGDSFGWSVDVSGDTALVGANQDDDAGADSGSAYVFVRDAGGNWTQQAKLTASDAAPGDDFGSAVALNGRTALIGARMSSPNGGASGSAYVFTRNGSGNWTQQSKLTPDDPMQGAWFGSSTDLDANTAIVGSVNADAAYVFFRDPQGSWAQEAKLTADDVVPGDSFGRSVSVIRHTAVVGSPMDDDRGMDSGSAYVISRNPDRTWTQERKLTANDGIGDEFFGWSVAAGLDTAIVGMSPGAPTNPHPGAAYAFCIGHMTTASFETFGVGCAGTVGVPTLGTAGSDLPRTGELFQLDLSGLPPGILNTPFGILGLSRTHWGSLPLPLDLTPFGIWNCTQYVSADASTVLVNSGGSSLWNISIPDNPDLFGITFYVQAGVLDFGVNPANIILTNAGQAVIGIR